MTVAAPHALGRHPALKERADLEHFVLDLSVGEVQPLRRQIRPPRLEHRLVQLRVRRGLAQTHPPCVTKAALVDLCVESRQRTQRRVGRARRGGRLSRLDVRRRRAVTALAPYMRARHDAVARAPD